ncbi:putative transcription initiation factor IID, 31kD subunit [Lyophyllum shimeji]|uniref:Transcription initiation factor IID, 31kD subunit n=1 Tax=Lyophyllum shimeji TaxID=47721 RepID=A0A9P3PD63_LYOSH|nr:putative transcription initiation factor IID, 31kD subunit [Lyophyllum shimeji]
MSRPVDNLPPTARAIALLVSSTPSVQDVQPGVLHQLLEFSHRYTTQVLTDASVYAEHAGRGGKVEIDDVVLAVQARVGWEFGGRVPKEYILSLATQVNATPLPPVPEVFGVRLPQAPDCLTAIDFDLVPNKPPPGVQLYDEEIEEIEESESEEEEEEEEEEMEPAPIPKLPGAVSGPAATPMPADQVMREEAPFPISAIATPSDIDMLGTPGGAGAGQGLDEGSEAGEEEDGLFGGGDDEEEESDGMEEVQTTEATNGMKRKLVEEEDYD